MSHAAPPAATIRPDTLTAAIAAAAARRGSGYLPRTKHLEEGGAPRFVNRLFLETSPYLLQHAHNPVDWHPWGDEAFAKARALGRPVLLSVGYSTCHWCHVMEEESFEDLEIATAMNAMFIPVKVDREERPDVDQIYMASVQALTGHGGWPMTVFLTPDREPWYGGTYFPARDGDRGARTGFLSLLHELRRIYDQDPERVRAASQDLVTEVRTRLAPLVTPAGGGALKLPADQELHQAFRLFSRLADGSHGGVSGGPKFPSSMPVRFLLRYATRFGNPDALRIATLTLEKMAQGGIRDHVAGGFHRYSVDEFWLVPHFEKMLYDNALLVTSYVEAWQATRREAFATVARDTLDYLGREMSSPEGAFFSATDADSANPEKHGEREEGWYFTWTPAELAQLLTPDEAKAVTQHFGVTSEGNFESRNILFEAGPPAPALVPLLGTAREKLRVARVKRPPPLCDDKILAAWNGLAISAFARAGAALAEPGYVARAERAARFVLGSMLKNGRLFRSYKDGAARHAAFLEDYAFLTAALLDLFEATGDPDHLRAAINLDRAVEARFEDQNAGGFFMTSDDHEKLLVREKPSYDGATPSGGSVHVLSLLRLAALTSDGRYRMRAERALSAAAELVRKAPAAVSEMLLAVDFRAAGPREIVLSAGPSGDQARLAPFLAELNARYVPNRVLVRMAGPRARELADLLPLAKGRDQEGPAAFVCRDATCKLPAKDAASFAKLLTDPG